MATGNDSLEKIRLKQKYLTKKLELDQERYKLERERNKLPQPLTLLTPAVPLLSNSYYRLQYERNLKNLQCERRKLRIPYDGHLGPKSYKPWQMFDYFLIRSIVDDIINKAFDGVVKYKVKRKEIVHEKSILLIMENLILTQTASLCKELSIDCLVLYRHLRATIDCNLIRLIDIECENGENIDEIYHNHRINLNKETWKQSLQ